MAVKKESSKSLAVYVIGISGSMDCIGCGKSSLCSQFVYDEYMEEPCSTLLQLEFDSSVINRRHTIYWGQKKKTYMNESSDSISVKFDIFEHTIFHEDGTNHPYSGHENYDKRVFTPLKKYANAYAFKSRDEVLNPEEYGSKKFLYSADIPVAYLYVMDVSQPFFIFKEQLDMMDKLVKSIQKKHCCVVVASKFDIHSRSSVESLESHANNLKVPVVHCSAKFNTNIHTAFKNLAVKALSLKKIVDDKLSPAKVPRRRPASSIFSRKDNLISPRMGMSDQSSNGIQSSTANNVPTIPPRMGSKTLTRKSTNSLQNPSADELSKRRLSVGNMSSSVKISDHSITLPITYYQNIFDFKTDSSKSKHTTSNTLSKSTSFSSSKMGEDADSGINPAMPRCDMTLPPLPGTLADDCAQLSIQQNTKMLDRSSMPLPPKPVISINSEQGSMQQSSGKLDRSSMPLPPTPMDAATLSNSEQGSMQQSSGKLDRSSMPLPPTPMDAATSSNSEQGSIQQSSGKLDRSSMPLPPTPMDAVISNDSKENLLTLPSATAPVEIEGTALPSENRSMNNVSTDDTHIEEYSSSSDGYERIDLLEFPEKQQSLSPSNTDDTAATVNVVAITTSDGASCIGTDKEITQADTDQNVTSATNTSTNNLPSSCLEAMPASTSTHEELLPVADTEASKDHKATICLDNDYVISDYEFYSMQKQRQASISADSTGTPMYLELKCLNPDIGNYILMHKVDGPHSKRALQTYTYDYVYHSYIEMCRRKLRQSGVPPRRVKREGHTPSVSVNASTMEKHVSYVNIKRLHITTLLPPRRDNVEITTDFPEEQSHGEPVMPPRNISRSGCYLSAPSATPM